MAVTAILPCWWWLCAGTYSRLQQLHARTLSVADAQHSARQITGRGGTDVRCHGDRRARCGRLQYQQRLKSQKTTLDQFTVDQTGTKRPRTLSSGPNDVKRESIIWTYRNIFTACVCLWITFCWTKIAGGIWGETHLWLQSTEALVHSVVWRYK